MNNSTETPRVAPDLREKLPDLTEIFFFRPGNRAFVTGEGPFISSLNPVTSFALKAGFWFCLVMVPVSVVTEIIVPSSLALPTLGLALATAVCLGILIRRRRFRIEQEKLLTRDGTLRLATLTSCALVAVPRNSTSSNLQISYRFELPGSGIFVKEETSFVAGGIDSLPAPGTSILVLYLDYERCMAL